VNKSEVTTVLAWLSGDTDNICALEDAMQYA